MADTLHQGVLLLAEPFLDDENFQRSVIMLCQHHPVEGSFGLVLNQRSTLTIEDVLDDVYADLPLYIGGPVQQNTLHYIHRLGGQVDHSIPLGDGFYWSGDFDQIKALLNLGQISTSDIRLFLGYSGWSAGQLAQEVERHSWYTSEWGRHDLLTTPDEETWRYFMRKKGGEYTRLANYPLDFKLN